MFLFKNFVQTTAFALFGLLLMTNLQVLFAFNNDDENEGQDCSSANGVVVYMDWSSCNQTYYGKITPEFNYFSSDNGSFARIITYTNHTASICIKNQFFDGYFYLNVFGVGDQQQRIDLKTNNLMAIIRMQSVGYDKNGIINQYYPISIPFRKAYFLNCTNQQTSINSFSEPYKNAICFNSHFELQILYCYA